MGGLRVQGQARRSGASSASSSAVPSAARLADVVRGDVPRAAERLVHQPPRRIAARRSEHDQSPANQSVSRRASALRAGSVLPLSIHDTRAAARERPVVGSATRRHVLRAGVAQKRLTRPSVAWNVNFVSVEEGLMRNIIVMTAIAAATLSAYRPASADEANKLTYFTFSKPVQLPGVTLEP